MKTMLNLLALALFLFGAFALWVRLAPSDPARWHVDPATAADPATPNFARAERVVPLPVAETRQRLDAIAAAEGAETLVDEGGLVTYVARSRRMRYPDYVNIRLEDQGDGTTRMQALARARFGRSDMGANAARLKRWFRRLDA